MKKTALEYYQPGDTLQIGGDSCVVVRDMRSRHTDEEIKEMRDRIFPAKTVIYVERLGAECIRVETGTEWKVVHWKWIDPPYRIPEQP